MSLNQFQTRPSQVRIRGGLKVLPAMPFAACAGPSRFAHACPSCKYFTSKYQGPKTWSFYLKSEIHIKTKDSLYHWALSLFIVSKDKYFIIYFKIQGRNSHNLGVDWPREAPEFTLFSINYCWSLLEVICFVVTWKIKILFCLSKVQ